MPCCSPHESASFRGLCNRMPTTSRCVWQLAKLYPMYDENIVREYGASLAMGNDRDEIAREQAQINAFLEK